ncbi:MAG TPA: HD domain-containing phosphohydrolase [Planctomycetota bacterium]|nr:HD domain-containing phosphohydrolase [Planctomycetota bacterium]
MHPSIALPDLPPVLPASSAAIRARARILLLDDERAVRRALGIFLRRRGFTVLESGEVDEALELLAREPIGAVVADLELPGAGGVAFLEAARERRPDVEVLFATGRPEPHVAYEALRQGACEVLRKPFLFDDAERALERALERRELREKTLELERLRERERVGHEHTMEVLVAMASLLDAKSKYTREHSDRVQIYGTRLAEAAGLPDERVRMVGFGGKIHDLGKVGIPDSILNKAGPLTAEERRTIEKHPSVGEQCLAPLPAMRPFVGMVGGHHENLDGSGYPRGLVGRDTPVETRILRIVDYFDAITSVRPYRDPMSAGEAVEVLRREKGRVLDPDLVELFLDKALPSVASAPATAAFRGPRGNS